jgi:glutathione S-transferase
MITETSVIVEYLDAYYPGRTRLAPKDFDTALEVRRWDRVFDHLNTTMSKIVVDNIRPEGQRDPYGIYTVIETQLGDRAFIVGDALTLADCSAAPSLWYATRNAPLDGAFPRIAAYLERLKAWPAFARAVKESEPLFHMYPGA